jgi:hypothetical protein
MQVFVTSTKTKEQPRPRPEAVAPTPVSVEVMTPREVVKGEPDIEPSGDGKWYVRCPTGLELVFPSSQLVLAWASVVDDPNVYFVSRGGEDFVTMAEWMQKIRQGSRGTLAFKTVVEEKEKPVGIVQAESKHGGQTQSSDFAVPETTRKSVAYQLEFKTRDATTQKRKKAIRISVFVTVFLILLGGAVFGAHLIGLF